MYVYLFVCQCAPEAEHKYKLKENLKIHVFQPVLIREGMESYGLRNWSRLAVYISPSCLLIHSSIYRYLACLVSSDGEGVSL